MPTAEEARDVVLDLHRAWRIYDECGHRNRYDEETGDLLVGCHGDNNPIAVEEIGWTCSDGLLYVVCFECCTDDGYQREDCVDRHGHSHDDNRRCETVRRVAALFQT